MKCPCDKCRQEIEFPDNMAGDEIACPICGEPTTLYDPWASEIRIPEHAAGRPATVDNATQATGETARQIIENVEKVVVGKRPQIVLALVGLFAEGHILLEDVPGVAKTMLARAIASSIGCSFKRIQCTPDLLPNDITGASVFNPKTTEFEFRSGPVFTQILLADEINRATPRAQSALLEAMAERQVSVDGILHKLEAPFFLIATQNPVDHEGTFPLPEAQLDRFLLKLSLGYPSETEENAMIERLQYGHPIDGIESVAGAEEVTAGQKAVRNVQLHERVRDYIVRLTRATREHDAVLLGGSPRSTLALVRAAQAYAAINGFDYVLPDDVKFVAPHVLPHRLIVRPESRLRKINAAGVVQEILRTTSVPVMPDNLSAS